MISGDPQVEPLIQVFELYLLRDASLEDMREPTTVATRAMLNAGMSPEIVLSVLDGAVHVAATEVPRPDVQGLAQQLREQLGPWLLEECFDISQPQAGVVLQA